MIRRPPRSTRTDTLFPTRRSSDLLANASTVQVWRGPMRAILAGAVESSRVALGAIARTPGWTLPLVISLPRDLDGRHRDFADLSGPASAETGSGSCRGSVTQYVEISVVPVSIKKK